MSSGTVNGLTSIIACSYSRLLVLAFLLVLSFETTWLCFEPVPRRITASLFMSERLIFVIFEGPVPLSLY